jgi:hypothetical protein
MAPVKARGERSFPRWPPPRGAGGGQLPFNVARGGESAAQRRWRCDGCRRSNGSPFGRRMPGAGGGRARPCQTPGRRQMTWCSRPGPARTGAGSLAGEAHPAAVKLASQSSAAAAATCARSHRRRFSCSAAARRGQRLQVPGHPAQPHRLLVQRGGLLRSVRQHAVEQRPDVWPADRNRVLSSWATLATRIPAQLLLAVRSPAIWSKAAASSRSSAGAPATHRPGPAGRPGPAPGRPGDPLGDQHRHQ